MPYVTKDVREYLDKGGQPSTQGQLNYTLTMQILKYMESKGGVSYSVINDIVGALESAKLEYYARIARPYEETKILENGDVF